MARLTRLVTSFCRMEPWKLQPARDSGLPSQERWSSPRRESGLPESATRWGWCVLTRLFFRCWNRLEVRGMEHLPDQAPFVLVANHSSHLDAPVLASIMPLRWRDRVSPIAAGDLFFASKSRAFFSGLVINALPVWRRKQTPGAHSLLDLRRRLLEDQAIYIVFPEGTRTRDGKMAGFKAGIGALVASTTVPVVPCYLAGTFEAAPPECRFPRRKKITVRLGVLKTFAAIQNDHSGWVEVGRTLESAIHELAERAGQPSSS
jgi:1-acyl-sn-glycerol-3-phosphate acyltransferase